MSVTILVRKELEDDAMEISTECGVGTSKKVQADCMFAVKRALCAYHFWECDASYPGVLEIPLSPALNPFSSSFPSNDENSHAEDAIYNSVCQDTCTDIGKLCGVVPSTGRALQLSSFTYSYAAAPAAAALISF
eukprot:758760-Hanusia_phi.AAC.4